MKIESSSRSRDFKILDGNHEILELKYQKWYSRKAASGYQNQAIEIHPKSSWSGKSTILKNGIKVGEILPSWKGCMTIRIENADAQLTTFKLRPKGFWKIRFELSDEKEQVLVIMKPVSHWKKLYQDYQIEKVHPVSNFDLNELLIYCGYSANLYLTMMSAV